MEEARPLRTGPEVRAFLQVGQPPSQPPSWEPEWSEGLGEATLHRGGYRARDGDRVPAYLLRPAAQTDLRVGVVVFHQHNAQWHLGKSEVAGRTGDPMQAFGPILAAAGLTVLAPDALGFEDRRYHTSGTEPDPLDLDHYTKELTYRLVDGDSLARKNLSDAMDATSALSGSGDVDVVGAIGHSFGGHTTLFLSAIDERVAFACVSGAAGSYRARMANRFGIGFDQVVPGIARRLDFDTLVACIAPRPLLLTAGENDRYALDVREIAAAARPAYEQADAAQQLECEVLPGQHALTSERAELICDWTINTARRTT